MYLNLPVFFFMVVFPSFLPSSLPPSFLPSFPIVFWPHRVTCGISVPQPGIELGPRQWKPRILTTRPPGNSLWLYFLILMISFLISESKIYSPVCTVWGRDPILLIFKNLGLNMHNHQVLKNYLLFPLIFNASWVTNQVFEMSNSVSKLSFPYHWSVFLSQHLYLTVLILL